jgi:predicted O-methyltransferase YrrM
MSYIFTDNWFGADDFNPHINLDRNNEINILEIGSHEGKSTVWFIENMLTHPNSTVTCVDPWIDNNQDNISVYSNDRSSSKSKNYENFLHNISQTNQENKVDIKVGLSSDILRTLDKKFDLIYIDGNHTSKFVLEDSVLSFHLLKVGGYMVWDDYEWVNPFNAPTVNNSPKISVDSFINCYAPYLKIIFKGYKVVIQKINY